MLLRSVKSKKTLAEDRKNFYSSDHGQHLLSESDKLNDQHQNVADEAMRKAAQEGRGMTTREINNVMDDVTHRFGHKPAVSAASRRSSAVQRFVARTNKKTGRAEWVPIT